MRIVKDALRFFAGRLGFEITRLPVPQQRKPVEKALDHERSCNEYDEIWSDPAILKNYYSTRRHALYESIIENAFEAGFFDGNPTVADIGCGPGHLINYIYERQSCQRLVGFDFSPEVLKIARTNCKQAEFQLHNINSPLKEEFDLLFCTEVLEHLKYPLTALDFMLSNARNVVLSVPNGMLDTYAAHINFWSLESWLVFLEKFNDEWRIDARFACDNLNLVTTMSRLR